MNIAIVDYGMGNLHSIYRRISLLNEHPYIAAKPTEILKADKIILPGVGHFEKAVQNLKAYGLFDALNEAVLVKQTPVLGICLGMQLFAKNSEEGDSEGFNWIDAKVMKFKVRDKVNHKVPQTGWNTVKKCKDSSLFTQIKDESEFYFLHAYHYQGLGQEYVLTKTLYEYEFVSSIEQGNIFGTQFHPEKSHDAGIQLLKNFTQL